MYGLKLKIFLMFGVIILPLISYANEPVSMGSEISSYVDNLLIPAIIALFGYLLKITYEVITERSKRRRELLEEKLKNFYWPILTRLEQNRAIWKLIFIKPKELNELQKNIGAYIEENIVLKNHRDIMSIIIENRYHVKFDEKLSVQMQEYFRHVAIYEGILESKQNTFPGDMGAPYPSEFDILIKNSTERLQKQLDKM